jgi:peptidoglycan glycosyltransferase
MTTAIYRLGRVFMAAFIMVALGLGYWSILKRDELLARQDNPRLLLAEQNIQRGQILDRNENTLAETRIDEATGLGTRYYPDRVVAPVVGYYSLQHGVGGIEAAYDEILRGDAFLTPLQRLTGQLLHRVQAGGDVRLTLDLTTQQAAEKALDGKTGTVIVMMVPQGDVLAIGSQPSFDPNRLDVMWEMLKSDPSAPLLNRATQSLYQPGTILQSIILGTAINIGAAQLDESWTGDLAASFENTGLPCAQEPNREIDNLQGAFLWACPGPFQILGQRLGAHTLEVALGDFGLLDAPAFELPMAAVPQYKELAPSDVALVSIGQSDLTVSALQMVLVAAAFADHGQVPAPRLVQATHAPDGQWSPAPLLGTPRGTISRANADLIAGLMARSVTSGAAQSAHQPDLTIYGQVGLALSGPKTALNSWFIGFAYRENGDAVAAAVLLENTGDAADAARVGGQVLHAAVESLP